MRTLFHRFLTEKTDWSFQKADLHESTRQLHNPSRGWYRIYTFEVEKEPDFQPMLWCDLEGDSLVMVILNIGAYKEKELDALALENMRKILQFFVKKQYEIILRITYDHEGKALEREPFFFDMVKKHLRQLIPVINEFAKHIFVYQGMLIGNWGEMHTSRFLHPMKLKELCGILRNELDDKIFTAVRRPSCWRLLHTDNIKDNMGLFDDAIFGSENHLGTFGVLSKENAAWDALWCKADELAFEEELCKKVPNGGEAICGEQYLSCETPGSTVETLRKMHITYLNKEYDKKLLGIWREWKWDGDGVWKDRNMYDYIGSHLGYRFWVKDVELQRVIKDDSQLLLRIYVENVGFSNFFRQAEVFLEQVDEQNDVSVYVIKEDIKGWNSGEVQIIEAGIQAKTSRVYLYMKCKYDNLIIDLANRTEENKRVFLGQLQFNQI